MLGFIWSQPETSASVLSGEVSDYHKRPGFSMDEILIFVLFTLMISLYNIRGCICIYTHLFLFEDRSLPSFVPFHPLDSAQSLLRVFILLFVQGFLCILGFVSHLTVFSLETEAAFPRPR